MAEVAEKPAERWWRAPESEPATVGNLPGDGAPPYPTYGGALDASGRDMVTVKFGRTPVAGPRGCTGER